uniref:Uncharacterized protein n=1 Tax=Moniliophthora roreri TaxID=221103 RepID=A0A0W0FED1_MONRR
MYSQSEEAELLEKI